MANDFKSVAKTNIAIDSGTFDTMYTGLSSEGNNPSRNRYG